MHRPLAAIVCLMLVLAACGNGDDTTEPDDTTTTTAATEPDDDGTTTTSAPDDADADAGTSPIGVFGAGPEESDGFPDSAAPMTYVQDVRLAAHDGFDRFVIELDGTEAPAYRIGYIDPPARQDGSGDPVEVSGSAVLEVRLTPTSAFDLSDGEARETYTGPRTVEAPGTTAITEAVSVSDFEAMIVWALGVDGPQPFAVAFLEGPLRLVIDVQT